MSQKENIVREKSYNFALRIIKLYKFLVETHQEYTLSKQLLRSGTSIGANIEEALGGHSRKDFVAKLQIAYKETREVHYWLRLLTDSGYIDEKMSKSFLTDCNEIIALLTSILKTTKSNS